MKEAEIKECFQCRKVLEVGFDVIAIQEGVIGTRGLVELETTLLCSQECLERYCCNDISTEKRIA